MAKKTKPKGWRKEKARHSMAARGIKTGRKKCVKYKLVKNKGYQAKLPTARPEKEVLKDKLEKEDSLTLMKKKDAKTTKPIEKKIIKEILDRRYDKANEKYERERQERLVGAKKKAPKDIAPYITDDVDGKFTSYAQFEGMPPSVAKKRMTGEPNIDPNDTQNESPTNREMVSIAEKNNGVVSGYIIPEASGRDDARITIDGFTIKTDESTAMKLKKRLDPDEFNKTKAGYRFWWD